MVPSTEVYASEEEVVMDHLTLVMKASIRVGVGTRARFTPGIEAMAGEDQRWAAFCKEHDGKEGVITKIDYTPAKRSGNALIDMIHDINDVPYFWVKFDDMDDEQRIKYNFLTILDPQADSDDAVST